MTWMLMVIILNLELLPPAVHNTYIIEMFSSQKECIEKHNDFFDELKNRKLTVPDNFNLGCVLLKGTRI